MKNIPITWQCLSFDELSNRALYDLLQLRQRVFIVEQDCVYLDADGEDISAMHLLGYKTSSKKTHHKNDGQIDSTSRLVAYARIFAPTTNDNSASIGRVLNADDCRGLGIGQQLMLRAIHICEHHWPEHGIRISAQLYLARFYGALGFECISEPYLEDGIEHIGMHKAPSKNHA